MKKLLFIGLFLISFITTAQKLGADVIKFDSITSTVRDAYTVPYGESWLIFNGTTGQFEYTDGTNTWTALGGGGSIPTLSEVLTSGSTSGSNQLTMLDNYALNIGTGDDLKISHNGFNTYFDSYTSQIVFRDADNSFAQDFVFNFDTGTITAGGVILGGAGTDDQNATEVPITDAGGNYTATDVEGALAENLSLEKANQTILTNRTVEVPFGSLNTYLTFRGGGADLLKIGTTASAEAFLDMGTFSVRADVGSFFTGLTKVFSNTTNPSVDSSNNGALFFNTTTQVLYIVKNGVLTVLEGATGTDSGQGMTVQTKASVTETFDNSDVVLGGVSGSKRILTKFTGQNEITLDATITEYNQPFLLFHDSSSDSTLVKKGTSTIFKMAGTGVLAEDGFYFKNYETPTVIALASNEYLISVSNYSTFVDTPPLVWASSLYYNTANAANPNDGFEVNSAAGVSIDSGSWTFGSVTTPAPTTGEYALSFTRNTSAGSTVRALIDLDGLGSGQTVTVSLDIWAAVGQNLVIRQSTTQGWTGGAVENFTGNGAWQTVTFAADTTTNSSPRLRIEHQTAETDLSTFYIDSIIIN
ncbi:hypothetical protein OAB94_02330 [Flavobacteriaceae bacterium]|nr:hypothetical protein [Flavobacteriaceae bacterium]